jgi:methylthioribose-1-phosphate isomerase
MVNYRPIEVLTNRGVRILDQTLLPHEERYLELGTVDGLCEAIQSLRVRGAPLLGLCGVAGMAIAATAGSTEQGLRAAAKTIKATRPTAVDLGAGVDRALAVALQAQEVDRAGELWSLAVAEARGQFAVDDALAKHGAPLLEGARAVLTHCNTGALATGGRGTALALIHEAFLAGHIERVFATETRPLLQGARLTTWEATKLGIPCTLLPDTAAASLIASGEVGVVVTGADRITMNGDTANKIGTYGLALAAKANGIPFLIAAPRTTIDPDAGAGGAIPIEFRNAREVGGFGESRWAPPGVAAYNPAFDVTPAELITAIVTESGVARPPFDASIAALLEPDGP